MSFLPLFPSRFEMRSSNSDKKLSLDSSICLLGTYPVEIVFYYRETAAVHKCELRRFLGICK